MKKLLFIISLISIASSCSYMQPDYLTMISATELRQVMENKDILLIDVHTPRQKHIKGTDLFIPYSEVEKHRDKLPKDKNTAIYIYCEGGPMGNAAARSFYQLGYHNLFNLKNGAKAWRQQGFAFE